MIAAWAWGGEGTSRGSGTLESTSHPLMLTRQK